MPGQVKANLSPTVVVQNMPILPNGSNTSKFTTTQDHNHTSQPNNTLQQLSSSSPTTTHISTSKKTSMQNIHQYHHTSGRSSSLPKHAVEKLKKWLFDHFEHPYPTEEEKAKLAEQSQLTLTQINNWFVNARVRIWRPQLGL